MAQPIVEMVIMALNMGVTDEQFAAAAQACTPDLAAMDGFISRELLRADDGRWVDIIHWRDRPAALASAAAFPQLASAADFMGMIDLANTTMFHMQQVSHDEGGLK